MIANTPIIGVLANASTLTQACEVARGQRSPERCILMVVDGDPLLNDAIEAAVRMAVFEDLCVLGAEAMIRPGEVWLSFKAVAISDETMVQVAHADPADVMLRSFAQVSNARAIVIAQRAAKGASPAQPGELMLAYDALLEDFALNALLIDDADRIQHVFGGAARFLVPVGRIGATLLERIIPTWRAAVRAAIEGKAEVASAPGIVSVLGLASGLRLVQLGSQPQATLSVTAVNRLLDEMPMMLTELDDDMRVRQMNAQAKAALGVGGEPVSGRHLLEIEPRFVAHVPVYRRAIAGDSVDLSSVQVGERFFDMHYRPVERADGGRGCVAIAYDVTERETVRRRLQRVADILNAVPLGVVTIRQAGSGPGGFVLDSLCSSTRAQLPIDLDALVNQPLANIFPLWYETAVPAALLKVLATRQNARLETTFRPGLRQERHLQLNASWLSEDLLVVTVEDISRHVRIRQRQAAAQRLEAVGQMAGGIAHDLNGRLTSILLATESLKVSAADAAQADLAVVTDAANDAADLVAQLLAFSRKRAVRPEVLTVHTVLQRAEGVLQRVLGSEVRLDLELPEEAWSVRIDPGALEQTMLNLASNARAAMPQGGALRIRVSNRHECSGPDDARLVGEALRRVHQTTPPGASDAVQIEVIDTGCGMSAEIQARCFEPYFSSNGAEVSSGLGLSSVLGIVEQAGGQIGLDSAVGRGTRLVIVLPRVHAVTRPPQRNSQPLTRPVSNGPARILVVDDEDLLRTVLVKQLRYLGYAVSQAESGEAALAVVEAEGRFDLVLTDVVMPGMNGVTLARRLRKADPGLRVLFMSGYADHAAVQTEEWMQETLLEKPFRPADLRRAVRTLLSNADDAETEN